MQIVEQIRAWLIFFRAHTAILETPMAVIGAGLALGTVFHWDILYWIVFGVAYHFIGYGMNSYVDWAKGYDKEDPHKQHHPLNTGQITASQARHAVFGLLILFIVYALWLGNFSFIAGVGVALMFVSGVTYNYLGKITDHKYIPISVVHTMVFVYPYLVLGGPINIVILLGIAAFFIHHVYQIAISGDIKDIAMDESSLIRKWGADITTMPNGAQVMRLGTKTQYIAGILVFGELGLGISIHLLSAEISSFDPAGTILLIILGLWLIREHVKLTTVQPYRRQVLVSTMSRKELAGFWFLSCSFIPLISIQGFIAIVVVSLAYFFPISKLMWGNWLRPDV